MSSLFAFAFVALVSWGIVKGFIWGGPFAPRRGWSRRQKARMKLGKSPWTFRCWITYHFDRNADIRQALRKCGEWQ